MSSPANHDIADAFKFNAQQALRLGWYEKIPPAAILDHPDLDRDPLVGSKADKTAFALAVARVQARYHLDCDGKLGRGTWAKILKAYDRVPDAVAYVVDRGRRLRLSPDAPLVRTFDNGGLDLHRNGDFYSWNKRRNRHRRVVLHWGGHTRRSCYNALTNRGLSSHYGGDPEGFDQWLDLGHTGWHAGFANADAIGIDVCQQPTTSFAKLYEKRGLLVETIDNPARTPGGRLKGDRRVLTLDTRTADGLLGLLRSLCTLKGIPFRVPRGDDGKSDTGPLWHGTFSKADVLAYEGIICHGHVSKSKWDVNPWMAQLFFEEI